MGLYQGTRGAQKSLECIPDRSERIEQNDNPHRALQRLTKLRGTCGVSAERRNNNCKLEGEEVARKVREKQREPETELRENPAK